MEFNDEVLHLIKSYPTDGTHDYDWPRQGASFDGVTKDLMYKGVQVAKSRPDGKTYCCGLTFEVWFALATKLGIDLISAPNAKRIKSDWFVATGKRGGPVDALVPRYYGIEIKHIQDAKPGDFVQLWRHSGSGHSVILMDKTSTSITYWSTQPVTKGIGIHTEIFDRPEMKNSIFKMFIVRATT